MSGPVRPPLTVEESDGSVVVRPANTIKFNEADFTVAKSGNEATISIDSTGTGAALTATQVGFGDSSNLLTGSTKFTYNDTAGSEQLKLIGTGVTDCGILLENTNTGSVSAPDLVLYRSVTGADNDFIGRMDYRGKNASGSDVTYVMVSSKINDASEDAGRIGWFVSGNASLNADDAQLMIFGRTGLTGNPGLVSINNSARSDVDFRVSGNNIASLIRTDASQDNVGIGGNPDSGVNRLHVQTSALASTVQRWETTAAPTTADFAVKLEVEASGTPAANGSGLGCIDFIGVDSAGNRTNYARMAVVMADKGTATEDGILKFDLIDGGASQVEHLQMGNGNVVINEDQVNVNFRVEGNSNDSVIRTVANQDNVGMGGVPDSGVERLHVIGTGTDTLVRLESSDAGADNAPDLELFRNSPSPASADYTGAVIFSGYEDTGASSKVDYARIDTRMFGLDGTESGALTLYTRQNNALRPQISMNQAGVIFNENQQTVFDFKVETSGNANMFVIDSGSDNIGIGKSPDSGALLHIKDDGTKSHTVLVESTDNDTSVGPVVTMRRNNADGAATDGDNLGQIQFIGLDDIGGLETYAKIRATAADTHSVNAEGAIEFTALYNGTDKQVMRIGPIGDGGSDNFGVDVNYNSESDVDFRVRGDNVTNLIYADVGSDRVGVGAFPNANQAQLQVDGAASHFYKVDALYTANHDVADIQTHGHVLQMRTTSGTGVFNLPDAEAGMNLICVNTGSGMNFTVATGDTLNGVTNGSLTSAITTSAAGVRLICIADDTWVAYPLNPLATS